MNPKLWARYVDDTFVILKRADVDNTHQLISNVFEGINFTIETENDNQLAFLDVLITRKENGSLQTSVYRKKTHTDQILSFNSNHPQCHKKSCIRTLFDRARTHCNTIDALKREENHLMEVFRRNKYPSNFIKRCVRGGDDQKPPSQQQSKRVVLPYIKNVSELTTRLLRPTESLWHSNPVQHSEELCHNRNQNDRC